MRISDWSSDVCSSDLRTVALETAGTGITCNAVSPGTLPTPAIETRIADLAAAMRITRAAALREYTKERQPSRRFVEQSDVGAVITYLCGMAGRDINGPVHPVDGGWSRAYRAGGGARRV